MTISAKELAEELVNVFGTWVGTPSEELLEDGGTVIDHLVDAGNFGLNELESIDKETWEAAWDIFFEATDKKQVDDVDDTEEKIELDEKLIKLLQQKDIEVVDREGDTYYLEQTIYDDPDANEPYTEEFKATLAELKKMIR